MEMKPVFFPAGTGFCRGWDVVKGSLTKEGFAMLKKCYGDLRKEGIRCFPYRNTFPIRRGDELGWK